MRILFFCIMFGFGLNVLLGQIDTLKVDSLKPPIEDSSVSTPIDSLSSSIPDSLKGAGNSGDSLFSAQGLNDSLIDKRIPQNPKKTFRLKDYKPQFLRTEDKARLRLEFPWREAVDIPIPKGFLPSPWTDVPDPDVSWQRALMFPGLGQVYNRSSWKVPIFYLGYGAVGGWLAFTNSQYTLYQRAFFCEENGCEKPAQAIGDGAGLRTQRETWRQRRDQAILILIAWHGISAAEAYVDAHLKDFDVSEDLSFKFAPGIISGPSLGLGLGVSFSFEKKQNSLEYVKNSSPWLW